MNIMEKELEQAVRDYLIYLKSAGANSGECYQLLTRCLQFIDYCKFEFGEDITKR